MSTDWQTALRDLNIPTSIVTRLDQWHQRRSKRPLPPEDTALIGQAGFLSPDATLLYDAIVALSLGKNVLLQGPTGSGKTKLAEYLSWLFRQPLHSVNCSVDLDAEALLGFKTLLRKDQETAIEFIPGPVTQAIQKGHYLYIDEINMARPETLPILNGVLDHRRSVTNPFTGEVLRAREGFGVIAAINIGYIGTVPLNEALKNRFVILEVPYLQGDALEGLLVQHTALRDADVITRFVRLSEDLVLQSRRGQVAEEAASIRALMDACDLAAFMPPIRAIQRSIVSKLEDDRERAAVMNIAETWF